MPCYSRLIDNLYYFSSKHLELLCYIRLLLENHVNRKLSSVLFLAAKGVCGVLFLFQLQECHQCNLTHKTNLPSSQISDYFTWKETLISLYFHCNCRFSESLVTTALDRHRCHLAVMIVGQISHFTDAGVWHQMSGLIKVFGLFFYSSDHSTSHGHNNV